MNLISRIGEYFTAGRIDKVKSELPQLMLNVFDHHDGITSPHLGLDVDGTMDVNPRFFEILSHLWPGKVTVITLREDSEATRRYVADFRVRFDHLVSVKRLEDKAKVIVEHNVTVFVDDQDEALCGIPDTVTVLKIRDPGGNFDEGKWLYSRHTGIDIEDYLKSRR
jgi:hypothetical protein